jgi:alpha-tubulin suppressor-like RCC1 family protein
MIKVKSNFFLAAMRSMALGLMFSVGSVPSFSHAASGQVFLWNHPAATVSNVPPGLTNVVAVAAGLDHLLALREDGTVVAWGKDSGYGETHVPSGLSNVIAISAGWLFSVALRSDGTVITWGHGTTVPPRGLTNVVAISAGGHQFCLALRADKTVVAWGWNGSGQTNVPPDLTNVVAVAGGLDHSAALRGDGTVVAWGTNDFFGNLEIPAGLSNVVAISAGWSQTLALRNDGTVTGWGFDAHVPSGLSNVVGVAGGWDAGQEFLQRDGLVVYGAPGLSNAVAVARGHFFAVAIVARGKPASVLRVPLSGASWTDGTFNASTQTRRGKVYGLEFENALGPGWKALPLVRGDDGRMIFHDSGAMPPQRFYRLLEW